MIHVTKLYPTQDATVFHAFGRVISGTRKHILIVLSHLSSLPTSMESLLLIVKLLLVYMYMSCNFSLQMQCTLDSRSVS